jgi:hypothetical protein
MRNLAVLFVHFIAAMAQLLGPGGVRSLIAESLLLKHQLLIVKHPEAISQPTRVGPDPRWLDGAPGASNSTAPFRNRSEAFDTASLS